MFFVILYRFFPCFVNVCFILKQKWGRMLHPNDGSHPHAGLAPQKLITKKKERNIFSKAEKAWMVLWYAVILQKFVVSKY